MTIYNQFPFNNIVATEQHLKLVNESLPISTNLKELRCSPKIYTSNAANNWIFLNFNEHKVI